MPEQAMGDNRAMEYMRGRRILEINPDSPVISALRARLESDPAGVAPTAELLYETALITGGFTVDSPKDFANRCSKCPDLDECTPQLSHDGANQRIQEHGCKCPPTVLAAFEVSEIQC